MKTFLSLAVLSLLSTLILAQEPGVVMPKKGLCAHRGCMDTHPENTLPSLREAIRLGAQMIEFDIQLTRDSVLVLMHDETVDRTTDGHGRVSDLTFAEIEKLDAGGWKSPMFKGTPVPTFEKTLTMLPRNVWLNCHLKGDEAVGRAVASMVAKEGRMHQAFLTCGERAAEAARAQVPDILICNGENRYRKNAPLYADETIKMKAQFIQLLRNESGENRKEVMDKLRENGITVNYYYAQSPDELARLFVEGVDFVLINDLARFQPEAGRLGISAWKPQF
ncbi:glycerophosphodiester phosphodiesterase [Persicitalea sp.]|uniref:glycerophosphodiester phosphodiesterase n=1 Tax=Persicitalea sp. TaxID=3100273 RepID=UPI003594369D